MEAKFNGRRIEWTGRGAYRLASSIQAWLPVHPSMVKAVEKSGVKVVFLTEKDVKLPQPYLFRGQPIEWLDAGVYTFSVQSMNWVKLTSFLEVEAAAQNGFEIIYVYEADITEA